MQYLFCCEQYHPSQGGVQEVVRQIAERLVATGHEVTVATSSNANRDFTVLNGVRIEQFDIRGNAVSGLEGDVDGYQRFLKSSRVDAILIKAAQQWSFDAAWDVLDEISSRKVFIPCGFPALYDPDYEAYFRQMPDVLRKFDRLIFYAEQYRDIDFARAHGLDRITIIPNGASEIEFAAPRDPTFRERYGVGEQDLLILTVGSPIVLKGHAVLAAAFSHLKRTNQDRRMVLMLNGDWSRAKPSARLSRGAGAPLYWPLRAGWERAVRSPLRRGVARSESTPASSKVTFAEAARQFKAPDGLPIDYWIHRAQTTRGTAVLQCHMSRADTVQAFLNADLLVLASCIEYSPLVLFEAAAAGLPFLTVPVGNAAEIAEWTGGGIVCPADQDELGYTRPDPKLLARYIDQLLRDPDRLRDLGTAGRHSWEREYNWAQIAKRYGAVLKGEPDNAPQMASDVKDLHAPPARSCH